MSPEVGHASLLRSDCLVLCCVRRPQWFEACQQVVGTVLQKRRWPLHVANISMRQRQRFAETSAPSLSFRPPEA